MIEGSAQKLQQRQRLEEATAASARSLSGGHDLRFKRHIMHLGQRIAPVRAPHVHPGLDEQDEQGIRGVSDAVALRLLHSDPAIYRQFRPEGTDADLIYEVLEQFRVEALASEHMPGVRANLRRRFNRWSNDSIAAGLIENEIGLLIFSVLHVCRSRIMNEPIEDRISDLTEATRAGIYQDFGADVRELRGAIHDQATFAAYAAAIAKTLDAYVLSASGGDANGRAGGNILAMYEVELLEQDQDTSTATAAQRSNTDASNVDTYPVFTEEYDTTVRADQLVPKHARVEGRRELDDVVRHHGQIAAYLRRALLGLAPAPLGGTWHTELEEGFVNPRVLPNIVMGSTEQHIYRQMLPEPTPHGAVTILIDCSGSMKGNIAQVAALVDMLARALDRIHVPVEVLGFTTSAWHGGRPRADWISGGRPGNPGRLNEICHIVFKDADDPWSRARSAMGGLTWLPMFREGIDGEAVRWAFQRLQRIPAPRKHLIFISDGSPMDGSTALANGEDFLDRHLVDVMAEIEASPDVEVLGLGIGHDMSMYLRRSSIVDPQQIMTMDVARTIVAFLTRPQ